MGIAFTKLLTGGYRAELGPFTEQGRTKAAAREKLFGAIAAEPSDAKPYAYKTSSGDVWVLYRSPGAWIYETPTGSACVLGGTRDEAINKMCSHVAQYYEGAVAS